MSGLQSLNQKRRNHNGTNLNHISDDETPHSRARRDDASMRDRARIDDAALIAAGAFRPKTRFYPSPTPLRRLSRGRGGVVQYTDICPKNGTKHKQPHISPEKSAPTQTPPPPWKKNRPHPLLQKIYKPVDRAYCPVHIPNCPFRAYPREYPSEALDVSLRQSLLCMCTCSIKRGGIAFKIIL